MNNYNYNFNQNDDYKDFEEEGFNYSQEDLDDMYEDAFEGDPDAYWNID